jgi:hypothetical protein
MTDIAPLADRELQLKDMPWRGAISELSSNCHFQSCILAKSLFMHPIWMSWLRSWKVVLPASGRV